MADHTLTEREARSPRALATRELAERYAEEV
jgi:hypothetical protein